jgi:heat shock protein HslJ
MTRRPRPHRGGRPITALVAVVTALIIAIASLATALAQEGSGTTAAEGRDWRLLMLAQDGALVDVADLVPAETASATASSAPAGSGGPVESSASAELLSPTLSIESAQRVGGWTGCNAWTATFTMDGDSLTLGPIASTRGRCPEPAHTLENTYLDDLAKVASWALGADSTDASLERLLLSDANGDVILVYEPIPASPVLGSWRVTAYRDASGATVAPIGGSEPTATFDPDGHVGGSTGCNSYDAAYQVSGQALAIGPIATTLVACVDPAVATQEQDFLTALGASTRATALSGTSLLLTDDTGATTLILESIAPPPTPTPSPTPSPVVTPTPSPSPSPSPTPVPKVKVPDVTGATEADAITALNDRDLLVGDRYKRYSDELAKGLVVRTDPQAGTKVKQGSRVDLYVSRGPEATPTPTATPKAKPTATPTARPTATPKPTARPTATPKPTATPAPTPDPGTLLDGTSWVLHDFRDSSGSVVVVPSGVQVTADFGDGTVSGFSGCNTYSGSYTTKGYRITITGFATTGLICDGSVNDAEATYLAALAGVDRFNFRDDQSYGQMLVLTGPDDETRLRYVEPAG